MRFALRIAGLLVLALPVLAAAQDSTLRDARVGEWVLYTAPSGSLQERHSVVARRREVVVVRIDQIINGKVISSNTENYRVDAPPFLAGAEGQQQITVRGQTYDCIVVRRGASRLPAWWPSEEATTWSRKWLSTASDLPLSRPPLIKSDFGKTFSIKTLTIRRRSAAGASPERLFRGGINRLPKLRCLVNAFCNNTLSTALHPFRTVWACSFAEPISPKN